MEIKPNTNIKKRDNNMSKYTSMNSAMNRRGMIKIFDAVFASFQILNMLNIKFT